MNETLNALAALVGEILAQRWRRQQEQTSARVREAPCGPEDQSTTGNSPQPLDSDTVLPAVRYDSTEAGP